jgi:hypothetical protein
MNESHIADFRTTKIRNILSNKKTLRSPEASLPTGFQKLP